MKRIFLLFLLIPTAAIADDTSNVVPETFGGLMTSFVGTANLPTLCGYGYSHTPDGTCVEINATYQAAECPKIEIDGVFYNTHRINLDTNTFRYPEPSEHRCLGMYSLYYYNPDIFVDMASTGDYFAFGPSMCGYGEYNLNGTCVAVSSTDAQQKCNSGSHMTVATNASFMGPNREDPRCNGDYTLYDFVTQTSERIYPLYVGTYLFIGTELKVNTYDDMVKNRCMSGIAGYEDISAEYYSIDLIGVSADYQPFQHPKYGMCDSGFRKFVAHTDCKDIDTSSANSPKECWVLCTGKDEVYTNSGICATGYCMNGSKKMRLHVARPDGEKYDYPLYASKTSTPALNFKFLDKDTNAEKMCYVNLVPPDAINHFVTTKPNPIRVGKTFTWFDSAGKEHTAPNLITID